MDRSTDNPITLTSEKSEAQKKFQLAIENCIRNSQPIEEAVGRFKPPQRNKHTITIPKLTLKGAETALRLTQATCSEVAQEISFASENIVHPNSPDHRKIEENLYDHELKHIKKAHELLGPEGLSRTRLEIAFTHDQEYTISPHLTFVIPPDVDPLIAAEIQVAPEILSLADKETFKVALAIALQNGVSDTDIEPLVDLFVEKIEPIPFLRRKMNLKERTLEEVKGLAERAK